MFQRTVSLFFGMSCILSCYLGVHAATQQFSHQFLDAIAKKKSLVKKENKGVHLYRTGSQLITAMSIAYGVYAINALYGDTCNTYRRSYLPAWANSCSYTTTMLMGSIGIGVRVLLYKTVAQIILALATCSVKENLDYLMKVSWKQD